MLEENGDIRNNSNPETGKHNNEQMKSDTNIEKCGIEKCKCGSDCNCRDNNEDKCENQNTCKCTENCTCKSNVNKCCKGKGYLPVFLSIVACAFSITALLKTCNKPCETIKSVQSATANEGKIRSAVIDVIKNDPQMLIDAMSAGIAKQRSDGAKQQALEVNKYKDEIIKASYVVGNKNSETAVICFFDPLCSGCIEFQKEMVHAVVNKKDVCFYLIPVAVLGVNSEELVKFYHEVMEKYPNKLTDFISELVKNPDDVESVLKKLSIIRSELSKVEDISIKKQTFNLSLFDKIHATAVPAMFIKTKSGNFTAIDEDELSERLT